MFLIIWIFVNDYFSVLDNWGPMFSESTNCILYSASPSFSFDLACTSLGSTQFDQIAANRRQLKQCWPLYIWRILPLPFKIVYWVLFMHLQVRNKFLMGRYRLHHICKNYQLNDWSLWCNLWRSFTIYLFSFWIF